MSRSRPRRALAAARRHPLLTAGLALVALLVGAAAAAPWLAAADPMLPFDAGAGKRLPPGAERWVVVLDGGDQRLLAEEVERRGELLALRRLGREAVYPAERVAGLGADGLPPRHTFLLGTDKLSRDLWARLLYGARVSLAVGVLSAVLALTLGLVIGCAAATGGALVDGLLMRLVDMVLAVPRLFLILALVAFLRPGPAALVAVLGATTWMTISRLVRAELLALGERDFVVAARAIGQRPLLVLVRHMLPNALAPALVFTGLLVGNVILAEAALSFLSFGIPEPIPSWGKMIADVTTGPIEGWWVAVFPGLAIALTVVAFNLLADGLRDALDPRTAGRPAVAE